MIASEQQKQIPHSHFHHTLQGFTRAHFHNKTATQQTHSAPRPPPAIQPKFSLALSSVSLSSSRPLSPAASRRDRGHGRSRAARLTSHSRRVPLCSCLCSCLSLPRPPAATAATAAHVLRVSLSQPPRGRTTSLSPPLTFYTLMS